METKKRNYSKAFKDKAISLSYQRDNIKDLANELGIRVERIYRWRKAKQEIENPNLSTKKPTEDLAEIKRLKKELKNTQLELEILKKAVHIFSRSDGNSINL